MKSKTKTAVSLFMITVLLFLSTTSVTSNADFRNYNSTTGRPTSKNSVIYDFEYVTGSKNSEKDNYIPSFTLPSYNKSQLANINETVFSVSEKLNEQKTPLFIHSNSAISDGIISAEIVSAQDGAPVRYGNNSLKISFDFSAYNTDTAGTIFLRSTAPTFSFKGSPVAIGCWVYIPENTSVHTLYLGCSGKVDGNAVSSHQEITSGGTNWCGWKYLEFDLTKDSDFITSFYTGSSYAPYGISRGCGIFYISYDTEKMSEDKSDTIYIDDINLIYDYGNTDTEKPKITYIGNESAQIVDNKTVYTIAGNTFIAKYSDVSNSFMTDIDYTSVKMYIDGIDVTEKCNIDTRNDKISLKNQTLDDGRHSIRIEVSDMAGNKETQTRYFTINTKPAPETTKPTATTAPTTVATTVKQTSPATEKTTVKKEPVAATEAKTTVAITETTASSTNKPMAAIPEKPMTSVPESTTQTESVTQNYIAGDINGDNKITASDARLALRIAARLDVVTNNSVLMAADMNNDGRITAADARIILRKAARLE